MCNTSFLSGLTGVQLGAGFLLQLLSPSSLTGPHYLTVPAPNLWEWSVPNTTTWEIQMNLANFGSHGLLFTQNTGKEKGQPEWGGVGFFLIWTEMHDKDEVSFFFFFFFSQKNRLWPGGNPVIHEKVHKTRTRSTFLTCLSTPIRPIITKPVIKLGKGNHTMWLTVSGIFQFL